MIKTSTRIIAALFVLLITTASASAHEQGPNHFTFSWITSASQTDAPAAQNAEIRNQISGAFHYPSHLRLNNPAEVFVHLFISVDGKASVPEVYSSSPQLKEFVKNSLEDHIFQLTSPEQSGHYEFTIRFALI
ncbi:MAG: hypothetical protein SH856_04140 [Flavobacteriales bacterium]|nr:hypothetical protein [Flavobacteriales bacterium]